MRKADNSLIIRLCLPQFAVGLFTTMLNNYLIYFYQPSKVSGIPELIQDGPMRVNAYTVSSFFFVTGSALGYVSPLIVSAFKGAGMETLSAWRTTFGIYTSIGIILLLIPAYTIREKDYVHSIIPNVTLGESLKHAFSNKHFRLVTLGQLLENTGMAFFQACIMYYVTSLMGLAETYSVLILAIFVFLRYRESEVLAVIAGNGKEGETL